MFSRLLLPAETSGQSSSGMTIERCTPETLAHYRLSAFSFPGKTVREAEARFRLNLVSNFFFTMRELGAKE
jgi:hypothetical protein